MATRLGSCVRCGRCCSEDEISMNNKLMQTGNVIDGKTYCKHLTKVNDDNGTSNGIPIKKFSCAIFEEIERQINENPDFDFNTWYKGTVTNQMKNKIRNHFGMTNEKVSANLTEVDWIVENCIGYPDENEEGFVPPNYTLFPECSFTVTS